MLAALEYRAKLAVRRTMFGVVSGLLLFVGVTFLAIAGWIALAQFMETLHIALIFAGVFLGLGFIALAFTNTQRAETTMAPSVNARPATAEPVDGLTIVGGLSAAFVQGITAGMAAGKRHANGHDPDPDARYTTHH